MRIQNKVKHLWWSFLWKYLPIENYCFLIPTLNKDNIIYHSNIKGGGKDAVFVVVESGLMLYSSNIDWI